MTRVGVQPDTRGKSQKEPQNPGLLPIPSPIPTDSLSLLAMGGGESLPPSKKALPISCDDMQK